MASAPVAVLRALRLALDHDAGGQVGDADGTVGPVDVLPARAGGAVGVDPEILVRDLDVDGLVHHGVDPNRGEARVAARAGVKGGDAD